MALLFFRFVWVVLTLKCKKPAMKFLSICLVLIFSAGLSASASASTFFTDRTSFDAITTTTLEDFESFGEPLNTFNVTESLPDFTASETSGTPNRIGVIDKTFNDDVFAFAVTSGSNALAYDDNGASIGSLFNFSSPITALGLNIATSEGAVVSISGPGLTATTISTTANTPLFFGIIDLAGITSLAFNVSGGPNVGFDDVAYGTAVVPLPAALPLFASVLAGLGFFGWRRKRMADAV